MPTNTSKFNLVKPLKSEKYNVDVFNGNADIIDSQIYSKTEVDTALNGKANTVHTHPISEVVNLQTALNGKVDKLMATNIITNGDFSNGTTGWVSSGASFTVVGGVARFTASGAFGRITGASSISVVAGRRYYLFADLKTNAVAGIIGIAFVNLTNGNIRNILSANQQRISGIQTATASGATQCGIIDYRSSGFDEIEVYRFGGIDLTTTFGAGNEPTKEQMDKLLSVYPNSWFNGTSEIGSIGALMRASLGVQVVTPTLLNSRTGTAQYVVSNDALVIFRGTASGGSLNTNIFVLPENIRPIATRTFPISANGAFGVVTVATNGEVRQTVGALTNVSLDGIVFKVGV